MRQSCSKSLIVFNCQFCFHLLVTLNSFWKTHQATPCHLASTWVNMWWPTCWITVPMPTLWISLLSQDFSLVYLFWTNRDGKVAPQVLLAKMGFFQSSADKIQLFSHNLQSLQDVEQRIEQLEFVVCVKFEHNDPLKKIKVPATLQWLVWRGTQLESFVDIAFFGGYGDSVPPTVNTTCLVEMK